MVGGGYSIAGGDGGSKPPKTHSSSFSTHGDTERFFEWMESRFFEEEETEEVAQALPPRSDSSGRKCQFFVLTALGEKLPLPPTLMLSTRVWEVKLAVSDIVGILPGNMRLSWGSQVLEDRRTLISYGLQSGQSFHAVRKPGAEVTKTLSLVVQYVTAAARPEVLRLRVQVAASDLVLKAKRAIEVQTGILVDSQRLKFNGRTMASERCICDYGIRKDDCMIQLECPLARGVAGLPTSALERTMQHTAAAPQRSGQPAADFLVIVREACPPRRSVRFGLSTDAKVRRLKEEVAAWSGVPPESQLLLHRGRVLRDDLTASCYNLEGGDSVDFVVRGGATPRTRASADAPRTSPRLPTIQDAPRASPRLPTIQAASPRSPRTHPRSPAAATERVMRNDG